MSSNGGSGDADDVNGNWDRIEAYRSGKMAAILVVLCLAQAQESVFEAAKLSEKSSGVLAKLAIACKFIRRSVRETVIAPRRQSESAW